MIRCSVCLELVGEDVDRSTGDPVCETCGAEHELRADAVAAAFMARPLPAGARGWRQGVADSDAALSRFWSATQDNDGAPSRQWMADVQQYLCDLAATGARAL